MMQIELQWPFTLAISTMPTSASGIAAERIGRPRMLRMARRWIWNFILTKEMGEIPHFLECS